MEIIEFLNKEKGILFTILLFANIVDYLTGSWKARILKKENSKEGMRGIFNKICCWIMILIGFVLSYIFYELNKLFGFNIMYIDSIGWLILISLIINELRSILENLVESGIEVPKILTKGLDVLNGSVENINLKGKKQNEDKDNL